ncbi:MAG TPA: hypothetical protein VLH77_01885 [Gammaproteobacteria bacterium]|nr:hypothetical protein [Gammaproteobacteria bacterium]
MFERLQKPFLTVETGEAYQPIRLTYTITDKNKLAQVLDSIQCLEKKSAENWQWFWRAESDEIHFESVDSYQRNTSNELRLGNFIIRENKLCLNLPSFKRACLAVPFFHRLVDPLIAEVHHADFLNKVYGLDERLPHGFAELFKDEELKAIISQRLEEYEKVQEECSQAKTLEEAITVLTDYTDRESHKKLPFAERYEFELEENKDPDILFLGFYIFLRGRELMAIRRWFGETGYSLADAAEETIEQVFGGVGIDLIE